MDFTTIIFMAVIGLLLITFLSMKRKDSDGLITEASTTLKDVYSAIEKFEPKKVAKRKYDYTENDIQKQLEKHLKKIFNSVTREYGLEGRNATKIDFDVANKIGIEIKLARSVVKTSGKHRLYGQLEEYSIAKYKKNLIVVIVGDEEMKRDTIIKDIITTVKQKGYMVIYKIPN